MGLWAGIKHAINSTLGTNYFTPLDKILGRELEASDNVYKNTNITYSGQVVYADAKRTDTYTYPDMLMKCDGSIKIRLYGSFPEAPQSGGRYLDYTITTVVKHTNGEITEYVKEFEPTTEQQTLISDAIFINSGDILTVTIKAHITGTYWSEGHTEKYTSTLTIGANVIQSSLIEVL